MRHVEITSDAREIGKILRLGVNAKARRAAELWVEGIVEVMEESEKAGRRYYYPGLGWTRASLPGRPPAIQTGEYARSIEARRVGNTGEWAAGTTMERGLWLQFGTENMAPRPHFREGYLKRRREIEEEMGRAIER